MRRTIANQKLIDIGRCQDESALEAEANEITDIYRFAKGCANLCAAFETLNKNEQDLSYYLAAVLFSRSTDEAICKINKKTKFKNQNLCAVLLASLKSE